MTRFTRPAPMVLACSALLLIVAAFWPAQAATKTWRVLMVPIDFPDHTGAVPDFDLLQSAYVDPMETLWDEVSYGELDVQTTLIRRVSRMSLPRRFWNETTDVYPFGRCADAPGQSCKGTCKRAGGADAACDPLGYCTSDLSTACQKDDDCGSSGPCLFNVGYCSDNITPCNRSLDCGGTCNTWNGRCKNNVAVSCNSSDDCPGSDKDTCEFSWQAWQLAEPLQSLIDDGLISKSSEGLTPPGAPADHVFDTILFIDAIPDDCSTCTDLPGDHCSLAPIMYPPQKVPADGGREYRVGYASTAIRGIDKCSLEPGDWGDMAHEVGHAVALGRAHPAGYISQYELMDSAYPCGPGIYSRASQAIVGEGFPVWYPGWIPDSKILTLDPPTGTTEVLAPTDTDPNTTASPMALKVNVADGTYYMVECRKNPDPAVRTGCWTDGLVIQRAATPGTNDSGDKDNVLLMQSPPMWPTDPAVQGTWRSHWRPDDIYSDTFYDAANDLSITVGALLGDGSCTVTVNYGPGATPNFADVGIIPWLSQPMSTYETVDIWVDSSCNGYEADDPGDTRRLKYGRRPDGTVVGNGDDPCIDHENRVYARVRNFGSDPANDVVAHFDVTDPLGVGMRGPEGWLPIGTVDKSDPDAACLASIPGGGFCDVYVDWTPTSAEVAAAVAVPLTDARFALHSCVRNRLDAVAFEPAVAVFNQDGDREQENIAYFEVRRPPTLPDYPVAEGNIFLFHPQDNFGNGREFTLGVKSSLPAGWNLEIGDGEDLFYFLKPGEIKPVPVRIQAPPGAPEGETYSVEVEAFGLEQAISPDGSQPESYYTRVSGVLLQARTVIDTQIPMSSGAVPPGTCGQATITANGCLDPPLAGALLTVDFRGPSGTVSSLVETDGAGCFIANEIITTPGTWTVQALWQGNATQSSAVSAETFVDAFDPADRDCDGIPNVSDPCPDTPDNGMDTDNDGAGDACDCAPLDGGVFAAPTTVTNVDWLDPFALTWDDLTGVAGQSTTYNLIQGVMASLPLPGGSVPESCGAAGISGNVFQIGATPPVGEAEWYLLQAANACGNSALAPATSGPRVSDICVNCPHDKCTEGDPLDPSCSQCVSDICSLDSFCCDTQWDSICVQEARTICGSLACAESTGQCSHSQCTEGAALVVQCDDPPVSPSCVNQICQNDPFCCQTSWDGLCVGQVSTVCGYNCN